MNKHALSFLHKILDKLRHPMPVSDWTNHIIKDLNIYGFDYFLPQLHDIELSSRL